MKLSDIESRKDWLPRFWTFVDRSGECWNWLGPVSWCGHGQFGIGTRKYYAHRLSYLISHHEIPENAHICHHCDNARCVNPDHLYAGSALTNVRDAYARHRIIPVSGDRHHRTRIADSELATIRQRLLDGETAPTIANDYGVSASTINRYWEGGTRGLQALPRRTTGKRGSDHSQSKLSDTDVRAIRQTYASGSASQRAIAQQYGMSVTAINKIIRYQTWTHVHAITLPGEKEQP